MLGNSNSFDKVLFGDFRRMCQPFVLGISGAYNGMKVQIRRGEEGKSTRNFKLKNLLPKNHMLQ